MYFWQHKPLDECYFFISDRQSTNKKNNVKAKIQKEIKNFKNLNANARKFKL
jgi:hypothetical protein